MLLSCPVQKRRYLLPTVTREYASSIRKELIGTLADCEKRRQQRCSAFPGSSIAISRTNLTYVRGTLAKLVGELVFGLSGPVLVQFQRPATERN